MYTTRNRTTARVSFSGVGRSGSTVYPPIQYSAPCFLEGVYSWRTGRSNIDPPGSPPVKQRGRLDGFGIITPSNKGSFLDRLADRKRYIEDFQRAAFPAEQNTAGTFSSNRVSTTDSGHLFASLKVLRSSYRGTLDITDSATSWYKGDVWGIDNSIYNASPYTFGFPVDSTSPLTVLETSRQATANRYFASTAPDRNGASLGVTLIELLRGDIPSLLKNFRAMQSGYKSVHNYVGSEGLNIMFGWTPLIQEYANVIKVGMGLERIIYYESFRRKRYWDGPSYRRELVGNVLLGNLSTAFGNSSMILQGESGGPSIGKGVNYTEQKETVAVEDYHLSSKYVGLAKAGRRAESFSDQAMDVVKQLGLIDDPRMIWDLTPYSWLVDWFTTMGDSISNAHTYSPITGKYNVDYAYMTTKHTVSVTGHLLRRVAPLPNTVASHSVISGYRSSNHISKWRTRATPFGFGTQLGSLNAAQFGILVSLGLAKTR